MCVWAGGWGGGGGREEHEIISEYFVSWNLSLSSEKKKKTRQEEN